MDTNNTAAAELAEFKKLNPLIEAMPEINEKIELAGTVIKAVDENIATPLQKDGIPKPVFWGAFAVIILIVMAFSQFATKSEVTLALAGIQKAIDRQTEAIQQIVTIANTVNELKERELRLENKLDAHIQGDLNKQKN